nr:hypothetical protein [Tanacetum cinerariifolium]
PRPHESEYPLARKQVSLSSTPQSQLSWLHDPSGHHDVVISKPSLHITAIDSMSHSLGVASSGLFRGVVSASGIPALRLVDGVDRGVGYGVIKILMVGEMQVPRPQLALSSKDAQTQEQTLPPRKDPHMEYSKIVPQSERKNR